jgi:hypothetical protein
MSLIFLAFDFWVDELFLSHLLKANGVWLLKHGNRYTTINKWREEFSRNNDVAYHCYMALKNPIYWGLRKELKKNLDGCNHYPHVFPTGIGISPTTIFVGDFSPEILLESLLGLKIFESEIQHLFILVMARQWRKEKVFEVMKNLGMDEALVMFPCGDCTPLHQSWCIPGAFPGGKVFRRDVD